MRIGVAKSPPMVTFIKNQLVIFSEAKMKTSDIDVSVVVSFDCTKVKTNMPPIRELKRNYGVASQLQDEVRPFVCIGKNDGISQWAELTTEEREERLHIPKSERTWQNGDTNHRPTVRWKTDNHWVNGAVFEGPDDVWANLATDSNTSGKFRCVTCQMILQIRDHLAQQLEEALFPWP